MPDDSVINPKDRERRCANCAHNQECRIRDFVGRTVNTGVDAGYFRGVDSEAAEAGTSTGDIWRAVGKACLMFFPNWYINPDEQE